MGRTPSQRGVSGRRAERFVALLRLARREDFCSKPQLIDLQNRIVDARFRDVDYLLRSTIGITARRPARTRNAESEVAQPGR